MAAPTEAIMSSSAHHNTPQRDTTRQLVTSWRGHDYHQPSQHPQSASPAPATCHPQCITTAPTDSAMPGSPLWYCPASTPPRPPLLVSLTCDVQHGRGKQAAAVVDLEDLQAVLERLHAQLTQQSSLRGTHLQHTEGRGGAGRGGAGRGGAGRGGAGRGTRHVGARTHTHVMTHTRHDTHTHTHTHTQA
jgi:hypothetical protein